MTDVLSPSVKQQFFDNNGRPLVGGKLFTYEAGTTTKLATYTDSGGLTPNTNPVILDFRGEANLWIPPNVPYKYVLAPSTDTDPPTNPIWSVDNVVSSQLVTLYGGLDTGTTNAYVLDFTANFTSYADGIVIYWIPANTNTGPSTINVNGLGIVDITNQDNTDLVASQLVAGEVATIMYRSGVFLLLASGVAPSLVVGSFTPTWTGFSAAPTGEIFYTRIGNIVALKMDLVNNTGTSNTTAMTFTNLPVILRPSTAPNSTATCVVVDNGAEAVGTFGFGVAAGTVFFAKGTAPPSASGFTNSGSKGLPAGSMLVYST